jgi:hypothetical protein
VDHSAKPFKQMTYQHLPRNVDRLLSGNADNHVGKLTDPVANRDPP